jgi:prenyltransferase beta subunit
MAWLLKVDVGTPARVALATLAVCATLSASAGSSALAAPPNSAGQEALDRTESYLQSAQNRDGGFPAEAGGDSGPEVSAWAALGLAAAGVNPQQQKPKVGGPSVYEYLTAHASELARTTDYARELLVVDAAGASPYDFGGVDLVSQILGRKLSGPGEEGAFTHEAGDSTPGVNDTVFAILALSPVKEAAAQSAVQEAAQWLIEAHNSGGGWPAQPVCRAHAQPANECSSEVDMTGAAIEALNAAGRHGTAVQEEAFTYLHEAQSEAGGFPEYLGEEPNVASTAWAVQAMWSAGEQPESWVTDASGTPAHPLSYLASMQEPDGQIRYKASEELNGVWMTAQVAPAFAGQSYPVPEVPPKEEPPQSPSGPTASTQSSLGSAEAGAGGESVQRGAGVITGGGGKGAPLFSRPQPQSQGRTPGGVRLLGASRERAATREKAKAARAAKAQRAADTAANTPVTITVVPSKTSPNRHGTGSGTATSGAGAGAEGGEEVRGELIDATSDAHDQALEPVAPSLRSAGAGGTQAPWLAVAIGGLIALLILAGSQLERRRPQVIV